MSKKTKKPKGRKFKPIVGGATIDELKRWIEHDFRAKFSDIARIAERPRKAIVFKMWGPRMVYTISAWEVGGNPSGSPHHDLRGDGLMASCTQRFFQDGEDWHRGNDMPDGPLNKATWNLIVESILVDAIHMLPRKETTHWDLIYKGTTLDLVKAGGDIRLGPRVRVPADAPERKKSTKKTRGKGKR